MTTPAAPADLLERLRSAAIDITTTWVSEDAEEDGIDEDEREYTFSAEQVHDFARLYREAADALQAVSQADRKREFFRALQDSETAREHHRDLRHAMGHTERIIVRDESTIPRPGTVEAISG